MFVRGNEVIERHPSFDLFFCVAELLQSRAVDKREISHHIRFKYHLGQRLSELTDTASGLVRLCIHAVAAQRYFDRSPQLKRIKWLDEKTVGFSRNCPPHRRLVSVGSDQDDRNVVATLDLLSNFDPVCLSL